MVGGIRVVNFSGGRPEMQGRLIDLTITEAMTNTLRGAVNGNFI